MKDKKAVIFYFLMSIIFLDFGNQLRIISQSSYAKSLSNPLFSIVNINNTGSAFSLFQHHAKLLALFGIIALVFVGCYVFKNIKFSDKIPLLALTLFSAGTLGNIIERLKYGFVVDYIKLNFIDFPVFNCFDIMICTSIFLYFLFVLADFKNSKKAQDGRN